MTEIDLRETLERHIGGADVPPGDPLAAIARGRRRRHLRTGAAAGLLTAVVIAVPVATVLGGAGADGDGTTAAEPTTGASLKYDPSEDQVLPGGTQIEDLGDQMVYTKQGSKTVLLPAPPAGATAVSISVACLDPGRLTYPDGAGMMCSTTDVASPDDDPRAIGSYLLDLSDPAVGHPKTQGRTLAFTATAGMAWKLSVTYVHTIELSWGVNAQGQTYGVENAQGTPDLVAVYATNGKSGYAYAKDLQGAIPTSPADAQAQASAYPDGRDIPVYEPDGITRIGTFHLEGSSGSSDPGQATSPTSASMNEQFRPPTTPYFLNANGLTIGRWRPGVQPPDLIEGTSDDGVKGYIYVRDLKLNKPDAEGNIIVNVYNQDGLTLLGQFTSGHVSSN